MNAVCCVALPRKTPGIPASARLAYGAHASQTYAPNFQDVTLGVPAARGVTLVLKLYCLDMRATGALFPLICLLAACSLASPPREDSSISAKNFLWIGKDFCTGGQPSIEDLNKLKEQGVRSLLNLRRPKETDLFRQEEEVARSLGMNFFNIPVDSSNLQSEQVDEFLEVVSEESNHPVFIHCASAGRVGGFWIIYRVLHDNWSIEKAEEEARRIGLRSSGMLEFVRGYLVKARR